MTILDCCITLKIIKKKLVVLGVMDMRQLLLNLTDDRDPEMIEFPNGIINYGSQCFSYVLSSRSNRNLC